MTRYEVESKYFSGDFVSPEFWLSELQNKKQPSRYKVLKLNNRYISVMLEFDSRELEDD